MSNGVPPNHPGKRSSDTIPAGRDYEGELIYARTELDGRLDALLDCYSFTGLKPDRLVVSDAVTAICATENLAQADEAVEVLRELVDRAKRRLEQAIAQEYGLAAATDILDVTAALLGKMDESRIRRQQGSDGEGAESA